MAEHGITITITNNSPQVLAAFENAIKRGLLAAGEDCVTRAQDACPFDTGRLSGSISCGMVGDREVDIGTNVEYAVYVECGTGPYCTLGGGTSRDSWVYMGDDGEWHVGYPRPASEFLKNSVSGHESQIMETLKDSLNNA